MIQYALLATDDRTAKLVDEATTFDLLYRREYAPMVRLAWTLVGRRDVAEEIVQDAFVEAHRRWNRLCTYEKPGAWIRKVVLQKCARRERWAQSNASLVNRLFRQRPAPPSSHEETDPELARAIRSLPKRQGQVLALVAIDDLAFADVARILGCSEETARTHLRRARATLQQILKPTTRDAIYPTNTSYPTTAYVTKTIRDTPKEG
jgi:RNA polymerase sigma-70 factor, ECF subfamily